MAKRGHPTLSLGAVAGEGGGMGGLWWVGAVGVGGLSRGHEAEAMNH